jgi:hypothetical protein
MARLSKAEKKAERLERKEKRAKASGEIMEGRMRTAIGFGAAYVLTGVLPNFAPAIAENQTLVDGALAIGGGYLALTDDGPIGDYALGASLVGATQTLDTVQGKLQELLTPAAAA